MLLTNLAAVLITEKGGVAVTHHRVDSFADFVGVRNLPKCFALSLLITSKPPLDKIRVKQFLHL